MDQPPIAVRPSPLHGRGVFARRAFRSGDVIETCPVLVLPATDVRLLERTALRGYYYDWDDDGTVGLPLGLGCLYNHAPEPNAWTEIDTDALVVTYAALRAIRRGAEITIDYTAGAGGDDLWFDAATSTRS